MFYYKKVKWLLAALLLIFSSCRELTVVTQVSPDGSMERYVINEGDSLDIGETGYLKNLDDSWDLEKKVTDQNILEWIEQDNGSVITVQAETPEMDSTFQEYYIARKKFADYQELNNTFYDNQDKYKINSIVNFDKNFRWFYTVYNYKETFYQLFPFVLYLKDEFTEQEIEFLRTDADTLDLDKRIERYMQKAMFEEYYQLLENSAAKGELPISLDELRAKKDRLENEFYMYDPFDFEEEDEISKELIEMYVNIYGPNDQKNTLLIKSISPFIDKVSNYLGFLGEALGEEYDYQVIMPGQIIDTNAKSIESNKVKWDIDLDTFHLLDYEIYVSSRKINYWPTALTGLFILGMLIFIFKPIIEKTRSSRAGKPKKVLPLWVSIVFIVGGLACSLYFGWVAMFLWTWKVWFLNFPSSWTDKLILVGLIGTGLIIALIGVFHIFRWVKRRND